MINVFLFTLRLRVKYVYVRNHFAGVQASCLKGHPARFPRDPAQKLEEPQRNSLVKG